MNSAKEILDIPLSEIDDFPGHPFKVKMDADMAQLMESIREQGIVTPVTLRRKEDGRYEMISGHRRKKVCELLGMDTIRANVQELTRDEAILAMVDSNFHRSAILPSEKAFAYRMKLEAMKRIPGRPSKGNVSPVGTKIRSDEILAKEVGESRNQIQRYVRLTWLIQPLLDMVDEGRMALRPAVELSYLTETEQQTLADTINSEEATPSHSQAIRLRKCSEEGRLDADMLLYILNEEKANQRKKITVQYDRLRRFIPSSASERQAEKFIVRAVEYYYRYLEHERQYER